MEKEPKTIEVNLSTSEIKPAPLPKVLRTTPVKATSLSDRPTRMNAPRVLSISPPRIQLDDDNRITEGFKPIQYNPLTRGSAVFNKQPNSLGSSLINVDFKYLNISEESKILLKNILGSNKPIIEPLPKIEELDENSNANQTQINKQQLVIYTSQQRAKINTSQTQLPEQNTELQPFSCTSLIQSPEQPKTFILTFMGYTVKLNADRMSLSASSSVDFQNPNISKESKRLLRDIFESNIKPHPQIEELDENPKADQTQTNNSKNIELQPFSCLSLINHQQSEAYILTSKGQTLELKADQSESLADQSESLADQSSLLNRQKQTSESQTQTEQSVEQATQTTQTENSIGQASKSTQTEHIKQTIQTIQTRQTIQHTAGVSATFVYPDNLNLTPGTTVTNPIGENTVQRQGCLSSCAIS